jgi:hypothetical protein
VLAYLTFRGNDDVNAATVLNRLERGKFAAVKEEREVLRTRFEHWLAGGKLREYHHGWEAERDFQMGYVFRWDFPAGRHNRLYGFLTKPRPKFEVCVLCCHRPKDDERTDPAVKRLIVELHKDDEVNMAVRRRFNSGRQKS